MVDGKQINDCLGIAQYVTAHLSEVDAVRYLLTISTLSYEDWRKAKELLPGTCLTNKNTIEGNIKEIVAVFQNSVETKYLVENLGILPGLQSPALQLISYTNATLWAVKHSNTAVEEVVKNTSNLNASESHVSTSPTSATTRGDSPTTKPTFAQKLISGNNSSQQQQRSNERKPTWVHGASTTSEQNNLTPQLRNVNLAIKSGPQETVQTLEREFKKWNCLTNLKIEAYSRSHHSTMFRVRFVTPARLLRKWSETATWPDRMSVKPWEGNPGQTLTPVDTRVYKKRIFVGNLSPEADLKIIKENMMKVYEKETSTTGPVADIEVQLNEVSWKRQLEQQKEDLNFVTRKSVCVILSSRPGVPLSEVGLNIELYPWKMRRSVRLWNGQSPQREPQSSTALQLTW